MILRPRRSLLYVPGSNARAIAKSRTIDADGLIFDLEDSVAPDDKPRAREAVSAALTEGGFGHREIVVRINGLDTPWGREDLLAAVAVAPNAVLLPKVATPGDVMFAASDIAKAGASDDLRLWAMLESPEAVLNAAGLARTAADPASRLDVLVMGTNDLAKALRIRVGPGRETLIMWLASCVAAARCHGLDIIDGPFNGLDDAAGLAAEARQGRDFGMDGKTCIHPSQVPVCNAAFTPEPEEVAWARKVVAAFDRPEGSPNVLRIDGRMVERLHADTARRLLDLAAMLETRSAPPTSAAL